MAEKEAEVYKNLGNDAFRQNNFEEAITEYTKALALVKSSVYFANRALCHIRLENYGSALEDSTHAIELDPSYAKGYYRRGSAFLALLKYHDALKDFKQVAKMNNDKLAKQKVKACLKEIRRIEFEKAISVNEKKPSDMFELSNLVISKDYDGVILSPENEYQITEEFVMDMMQRFKKEKRIPKPYVKVILYKAVKSFQELPSLYYVDVPKDKKITVCGDTHGQYFDLCTIFEKNGYPSKENPYLFNGDFVDRGSWSVEVILTLLSWHLVDPSIMHLTRGNHESRQLNMAYGFEGEVKHKYDASIYEFFQEAFNWIPLSVVINKKVIVLHGGVGFKEDDVTLDQIAALDRNKQIPDEGIMCDLLWSDPRRQNGRGVSPRGTSRSFGPDVANDFMKRNGLELIIRSHEVKHEGYEKEPDCNLYTVFSAPNYCDQAGNKGSYFILRGDNISKPDIHQFSHAPHPNVKPMQYSSNILFQK